MLYNDNKDKESFAVSVRRPDFENNLLRVLRGQRPERPTLFEEPTSRRLFLIRLAARC